MMSSYKLKVIEQFRAFQGEGSRIGEMTWFIRLFGCNLRCAWCDTPYAINTAEHRKSGVGGKPFTQMSIDELADYGVGCHSVVITGGEPLIQYEGVIELINELHKRHPAIQTTVETNGTIPLMSKVMDAHRHLWSISPKLGSADVGEESRARVDLDAIRSYLMGHFDAAGRVQLKFVISNYHDLREVRGYILHELNDLITDLTPIIFQPNSAPFWMFGNPTDYLQELRELEASVRNVFSTYKYLDVRVLPQLHFLLHGNTRMK